MPAFESPNYTQVPNDLFDTHMGSMGEAELRVVLALVRQTIGYHRNTVRYSLTKLQQMTGLSRPAVIAGARVAEDHGFITAGHDGGVTTWLVNVIDQPEEVIKLVDQTSKTTLPVLVKKDYQTSKATLPPSIKESIKERKNNNTSPLAKNARGASKKSLPQDHPQESILPEDSSVPLVPLSEAVPVPMPSPVQAAPTPTPPAVPVPQAPVAPKASVLDMPMPMKARPDSERLAAWYFELFENGIIPNNGRFRQVQGLIAGLIGNGKGGRAKSAMQFKSYAVQQVIDCMEALKAHGVQLTSPNAVGLCIDDFLADDKLWPPDWLNPIRQRKSKKKREYLEWSKRKTAEAMAEDAAERAAAREERLKLEGVAA